MVWVMQGEGEDNEFTLACLELFHMKPGGIHSWHLPAPYFRHGMLVSATAGSTKVTSNALDKADLVSYRVWNYDI